MTRTGQRSIFIIFIAWLAYLISYIGRSDYSACILEIINETGVARATAGMVSSVFALCNAIGQVLSGFVIKRISPVKIIGIELFTVAVINILFPITDSFLVMAILWGINGFMQSTLLCGVTQIFADTLEEPYLSRGAVLFNTIGALGGMFNYVLSWLLIRYFSWRSVFLTVSTMLMLLGIIWYTFMPKLIGKKKKYYINHKSELETKHCSVSFRALFCSYGVAFVILGSFFVGLLRESVSLWIPSYINETFGLSGSLSIVLTAFVPCLQICGAFLGGYIGRRVPNLHFPSSVAFICSVLCLMMIGFLDNKSVVITLLLFVINAICMTSALTFLLSLFPIRYMGRGNVSMLVGIINFFVHAGDFVASFSIGWISQQGGWKLTFIVLCCSALIGAILCLIGGFVCRKEEKANVPAGI